MSLFAVDREKCLKDGICAAECPARIIEVAGKGSYPTPVEGAAERCINCGHCVAVCPAGALSLKTMKPEECLPVRKDLLPGPEQVEHLLLSRRSIRTYRDQPVERETLIKLIDTARYAPTGHNLQPVHWLVIEDKKEVIRLAGLVVNWMRQLVQEKQAFALSMHMDSIVAAWDQGIDRICRGAPHVIAAHAPENLITSGQSCTIALTCLELAAYSMGLGACWAGYINTAASLYPPMKEALGLPEGHRMFGALMVGRPQYYYRRIPLRKKAAVTWR